MKTYNKLLKFINTGFFEYALLFIVLIFGFAIRLYKVDNPIADWHSWRQADTASVTRSFIKEGISFLYPTYHDISSIQTGIFNPNGYRMVELPIYNAAHAVLAKNLPFLSLEIWGRVLTITIAVITALFLYLIGKRLLNKWGGLLACFFYLFIPFNIYFTRVILPDPLGVMFGVVSVWAFLVYTQSLKTLFFYTSAVFMSFTFLIKPYLAFYMFPIFYLTFQKFGFKQIFKDKKLLNKFIIYALISLVPFLVYRAWEARFPEGIPFYKWAFNGNGIRFKPSFWYWIFGQRLSHLILGGLGIIPFVFGVFNTKVKNQFISYFLLGAFVYITLVANANVMHDYYQIPVIPVIALALASGSIYLWEGGGFNKILTRLTLLISIGVMLITGWSLIKDNYNVNHPEIIAAGNRVDKITPKDALILAPYNGDTAFLYQTKRNGWPAVDDSIENIIKKGASFYASVDLGSPDTRLVESEYKTLEKTDKFIIIDLRAPLKTK